MSYYINENSSDEFMLIGYIFEFFIFLKWVSLKKTFIRIDRVLTENEKVG